MKEWKDMNDEEKNAAMELVEAFMKLIDAVIDDLVPVVSVFEDILDEFVKMKEDEFVKMKENEF